MLARVLEEDLFDRQRVLYAKVTREKGVQESLLVEDGPRKLVVRNRPVSVWIAVPPQRIELVWRDLDPGQGLHQHRKLGPVNTSACIRVHLLEDLTVLFPVLAAGFAEGKDDALEVRQDLLLEVFLGLLEDVFKLADDGGELVLGYRAIAV